MQQTKGRKIKNDSLSNLSIRCDDCTLDHDLCLVQAQVTKADDLPIKVNWDILWLFLDYPRCPFHLGSFKEYGA